jgi:sulfate permease
MWITVVAVVIAMVFAMNIGASGAAAAMGVAYGSGAIARKRVALAIVAVGVFGGAYLGGGEVVKTLGSGIIPSSLLNVQLVVIILLSATATLFGSNLLGIPLSSSEVTVGSVVGVGVAYQMLIVKNVLIIVSFWIAIPIIAFGIALGAGYFIRWLERRDAKWRGAGSGRWKKSLMLLVILAGLMEAFSAGMNNVANAVGPLVGAGLLSVESGVFWGGLLIALGAIFMGGRVLETNGKKITKLSLLQGIAISSTGGVLVIVSSLFGVPVPLTQVTTTAILAVGTADQGFRIWQKGTILRILKVWLVSPVLSLVISFILVKIFIQPSPYTLIVLVALLIAIVGLRSLYDTIQAEKRSFNEHGAGI